MIIESNLIDNLYFNIMTNPLFEKRLCYCKNLLLKEYLHKTKFFLIEIIQEFEKIIHEDNYSFDYKILETQQYKKFLCKFPYISKKIISIFCDIEAGKQKTFKKKIQKWEEEIKEFDNMHDQINFLYKHIIPHIIKWIEISILNLIAFNISCDNYKEDKELYKECDNIDFCYRKYFSKNDCQLHNLVDKYGEFLQIYITPEIIEIIDVYLKILLKYYNGNLKNVDLIVDYSLMDELQFSEATYQRYLKMSKHCKNIYVINYKHLLKDNEENQKIFEKIKIINNVYFDEHPYKEFF